MSRAKIEKLGFVGSLISTGSFLPQVWKVWAARPEPATSVSLPMYAILATGCVCWIVYGLSLKVKPIWLTNVLIISLALSVVLYKLIYG